MTEDKKYYAVNSRGMAQVLRYVGGFAYHTYNDVNHENREIYTFEDTEEFRIILGIISNLTKIYKYKN